MQFYYSSDTFMAELRRIGATFFLHFSDLALCSAYLGMSQLSLELQTARKSTLSVSNIKQLCSLTSLLCILKDQKMAVVYIKRKKFKWIIGSLSLVLKPWGHFPTLPGFSLFPSFLAALLSSPTTFKFMVIFYEKKDSYRFC